MHKIAIIGTGVAGLSCARVLARAGVSVSLFDKGRGPGGRLSTRRVECPYGPISFDHGAQYFTARDPHFKAEIAQLEALGFVARWPGRFLHMAQGGHTKSLSAEALYIGTPGMNALVRGLARDLNPTWGQRVAGLIGEKGAWQLVFEDATQSETYTHIICAVPAEQVGDLIGREAPSLKVLAQAVSSQPCWTGMFGFEAPLDLDWDLMRFEDHPVLDVVSTSLHKPGRSGPPAYVVQARADWSVAHLEAPADVIAEALLEVLLSLSDATQKPLVSLAHRWRYARVDGQHGVGCAFDPESGIGVCGDWLSGPRIESAWQSGHALGDKLLQELTV
ncbi:NAD(P)/FAD-dependent oxidoreductase [Candidatus Phycosocius spiralis]|uniref:FAD-dependent oxidoreductase n=1 Tax=Candidatus Phycosocius spiralis TaxID=2815099 RepID=A0ABQ4PTU7_9PROT|nr:FAD-dependent oxidoreductase [Candidatus Phycosocius spiralis]GIU66324.1 FAD-dependent oxidoreductase [Candidatus Phycosocius spiralis]